MLLSCRNKKPPTISSFIWSLNTGLTFMAVMTCKEITVLFLIHDHQIVFVGLFAYCPD